MELLSKPFVMLWKGNIRVDGYRGVADVRNVDCLLRLAVAPKESHRGKARNAHWSSVMPPGILNAGHGPIELNMPPAGPWAYFLQILPCYVPTPPPCLLCAIIN